jgi:hypothetical protein
LASAASAAGQQTVLQLPVCRIRHQAGVPLLPCLWQ